MFCWLSSFLGEVDGKPVPALRANNELPFCLAENPTPRGSSQAVLLPCPGCCLNKTHPELLLTNKYFNKGVFCCFDFLFPPPPSPLHFSKMQQ